MRVGVLAIQGDVSEHIEALYNAADILRVSTDDKVYSNFDVIAIRNKGVIPTCDGIVIPGGESTTFCRLVKRKGLDAEIRNAAKSSMPILATCAGLILLAKKGDKQVEISGQQLLGCLNVDVKRNAFGRQKESFEISLQIEGIGTYTAVFIRAPAIVKAGDDVRVLATLDEYIVAVEQENIIALAFQIGRAHV